MQHSMFETSKLDNNHFTHVNLVFSVRMENTGDFGRELIRRLSGMGLSLAFLMDTETRRNKTATLEVREGIMPTRLTWTFIRQQFTTVLNELYTSNQFQRDFLFYSFADGDRILESK